MGFSAVAGGKAGAIATEALDDFNAALASRDPGIASSFHKSALFIGSEPGEFARGREAIGVLLGAVLASPAAVRFEWQSVEAARTGDCVWFLADGSVVLSPPAGAQVRRPYRLTGVLANTGKGWRWRLFHGSEPWIAPPPANSLAR